MADASETIDTSSWGEPIEGHDDQVYKKILREGTGECPPDGCNVQVHYVGTLLDGTKFDSSRDRPGNFDFELGVGRVIKGWDAGVATMKKGELCMLTCKSEYAYGERGSPPKIPANATLQASLRFEVELLDFEIPKWKLTLEQKIEKAEEKKAAGTAEFKAKNFEAAKELYESALSFIDNTHDESPEQKEQIETLKTSCLLNAALMLQKLGDWGASKALCDKVLKIDATNAKALFRRGVAERNFGEPKKAKVESDQGPCTHSLFRWAVHSCSWIC